VRQKKTAKKDPGGATSFGCVPLRGRALLSDFLEHHLNEADSSVRANQCQAQKKAPGGASKWVAPTGGEHLHTIKG